MKKDGNEKKPFYKKRAFIIWLIVIAIIIAMYFAIDNIAWFDRIFGQA